MSILRTFSAASSRPLFTPPITGVNESNYWQKIEQLPSPAQGLWSLWVNNDATEVYASGVDAFPFYANVSVFLKTLGAWPSTVPNVGPIGSNATSKDGRRTFYYGGGTFYVVTKNNNAWSSSSIDSDGAYAATAVVSISSNGNAVFFTVVRSGQRWSKFFKFENSSWTQKLFFTETNVDFPAYQSPFYCLNKDGSVLGLGGNNSSGVCTTHIYAHVALDNSYPKIGGPITFQKNGVLKSLLLNDEGTRVAAIIATGAYENNYWVEVWEFNGTAWNILGAPINTGGLDIVSSTYASQHVQGRWFSYDGGIFVGRKMTGTGNNARAVQAYKWDGTSWATIGQQISGNAASYNFGARVWLTDSIKMAVNGGKDPTEQSVEIYQYIP